MLLSPPDTRSPLALRPPQLVAAIALAMAIGVAVALGLAGAQDSQPTLREQYGGHGGTPAAFAGPSGRVALDGIWRVAADPDANGGSRGYIQGRFGGERVHLPYVPNAGRITGQDGEKSHEGSVAWYRTRLRVPEDGTYALRFESVNHKASVYVDGRRLGGHTGEYLPFELRTRLEAGKDHTLVIRADWRDPTAMKAAAWHRTWFNFGGVNREVSIRPVGETVVLDPNVQTRLLPNGRARVQVTATVFNRGGDREIELGGSLKRGEDETGLDFPKIEVPAGERRSVRATTEIEKPALWSQDSPSLYELRVGGGDNADEGAWQARVGLRQLSRSGNRLLLNGKQVKLIGASLHEDAIGRGDGLRPQDMDEIVRELKEIHANATRAQHPLNPALLERLDAAGMLVWQGIGPVDAPGAFTSKTPELIAQSRERVRENVIQLQTHPSIVAWNLANEVAGQGHPDGQAKFIDDAAQEVKKRDPGRLVALDVWGAHPPKEPGLMYDHIDAIGWTNYLGWYEDTFATSGQLADLIETKLGDFQRIFPDKVIAVTEFGAEGNTRNPSDEPGGYSFQSRVLRTHIRTYARMKGLSGMLVWNLRDFAVAPSFGGGSIVEIVPGIDVIAGLNEKGLHRYGGQDKPSAAVVRSEYARLTGAR